MEGSGVTFPLIPRDGCPPEVAALAHDLVGAVDAAIDAAEGSRADLRVADERLIAAQHALRAAGWDLHGPTYNVPGGALSWEVVPINRVVTP
jgi:hypothetical protein